MPVLPLPVTVMGLRAFYLWAKSLIFRSSQIINNAVAWRYQEISRNVACFDVSSLRDFARSYRDVCILENFLYLFKQFLRLSKTDWRSLIKTVIDSEWLKKSSEVFPV